MKREEKTAVVEKLTADLKGAEAIFAIDYRGISVPQAAELRSSLREAGASFRVVKNRLTLRAADAAGTAEIKDFLTGPTALTLVDGDVALAAKTLSKLGGEWELLEYKGGIMDGAALEPDQFVAIAKLPGRDQLNAQFAGIVASPLTGLVRGLGSMISGLASQLQQIADQGLVSGEAPPAETSAEEEASPAEEEAPAEEKAPAEEEASAEEEQEEAPSEQEGEASADEQPPAAEESAPDPEPSESPEEEPSEERAPEGESAGEGAGAEATGEGDQDLGEEPDDSTETNQDSASAATESQAGTPGSEAEDVPADADEKKEDGE